MFYWKIYLSWTCLQSKCSISVNWIRYHRGTVKTKELKELRRLWQIVVRQWLALEATLSLQHQMWQHLLDKHQLLQPLLQLDLLSLLTKIHKKRLRQLLMALKQMTQNKAMVPQRKTLSRKKKIQNQLIVLKKKNNLLIMMMMKS